MNQQLRCGARFLNVAPHAFRISLRSGSMKQSLECARPTSPGYASQVMRNGRMPANACARSSGSGLGWCSRLSRGMHSLASVGCGRHTESIHARALMSRCVHPSTARSMSTSESNKMFTAERIKEFIVPGEEADFMHLYGHLQRKPRLESFARACKKLEANDVVRSEFSDQESAPSGHVDVVEIPGLEIRGDHLLQNVLYVRDTTHKLLEAVRNEMRVTLTGNQGTGKSVFQHYFLLRMLNPRVFGPLPPDANGDRNPPRLVVRHEDEAFQIYDTKTGHATQFSCEQNFLQYLSSDKAYYMYEPGRSKKEPYLLHDLDGISTVSPDEQRIKEWRKTGAVTLYNPAFDLLDLQAIAKHMREHPKFRGDKAEDGYYGAAKIRERYHNFGGIIRHCIPQHARIEKEVLRLREVEIGKLLNNEARAALLIGLETLETGDVSALIMQYVVSPDFLSAKLRLVNEDVGLAIRDALKSVDIARHIRALSQDDQLPGTNADFRLDVSFEKVVSDRLFEGVKWRRRCGKSGLKGDEPLDKQWERFSPSFKKRVSTAKFRFADMGEDELYTPEVRNFEHGDIFYRRGKRLIVLQVTRQTAKTRNVETSPLTTLLRKLGVLKITKDDPKKSTDGGMKENADGDPKQDASKGPTTKQTKQAKDTNGNQPDVIRLDGVEAIEFHLVPRPHNKARARVSVPNELSHLPINPYVIEVPLSYGTES